MQTIQEIVDDLWRGYLRSVYVQEVERAVKDDRVQAIIFDFDRSGKVQFDDMLREIAKLGYSEDIAFCAWEYFGVDKPMAIEIPKSVDSLWRTDLREVFMSKIKKEISDERVLDIYYSLEEEDDKLGAMLDGCGELGYKQDVALCTYTALSDV